MNAFEIIGLACVDETFRNQLFDQTDAVLAKYSGLTYWEREGLKRVTGAADKNDLKNKMGLVGDMLMRCPTPPCPWPKAYVQTRMVPD